MRWLRRLFGLEKQTDIEDEKSEQWLQDLENVAMELHDTGRNPVVRALLSFARIQMALSRRAHNQTRSVIGLTKAIVLLTLGLLIFTIYLAEDAYFNHKRAKTEQNDCAKKTHACYETQITVLY
jgi:hypothetical protein